MDLTRIILLAAWLGSFAGLRAAPDSSVELTALRQRLESKLVSPTQQLSTDWRPPAEELSRLAAALPDNEVDPARGLAERILRAAERQSDGMNEAVARIFAASANPTLREFGAARLVLRKARQEPVIVAFTALDGREVDLARLRGKVVLVQFWATWCSACKAQVPLLKELYTKYQPAGFEVVAVTMEYDGAHRERLERDIQKYGMTWPQFYDGAGLAKNPWTKKFGVVGAPTYLLLDKKGLLVAHTTSSGGLTNLEAVVRTQLGLPPLHPEDPGLVLGKARPKALAR